MDTDRLIQTLTADNAHRERPVGSALAHVVAGRRAVFAGNISGVLRRSPGRPHSDAQSVLRPEVSGDAGAGDLGDRHQPASVPSRSTLKRWKWLLAVPAGFVALGIAGEMMMPQRLPMMTRLVGSNSLVCLSAIPLLSLPLLAGALFAMRHGAPTRPAVAGAFAGLVSAGLAATLYASHCTRRFTALRGDLVHARHLADHRASAHWRDRRCCGFRCRSPDAAQRAALAERCAAEPWSRSCCSKKPGFRFSRIVMKDAASRPGTGTIPRHCRT